MLEELEVGVDHILDVVADFVIEGKTRIFGCVDLEAGGKSFVFVKFSFQEFRFIGGEVRAETLVEPLKNFRQWLWHRFLRGAASRADLVNFQYSLILLGRDFDPLFDQFNRIDIYKLFEFSGLVFFGDRDNTQQVTTELEELF